jgi:hypothetical protein
MSILTAATEAQRAYRYFTFQIIKNNTTIVHTHTLVVNPEEYAQDEGARNEVTKTIAGAYIEEWGRELISFSIKSTTGFRRRIAPDGTETDGFQAFKDLRDNIYRYFLEPDGKLKQRRTDSDTFELRFYNWEDEEYYAIMPSKFALNRSKSRPLLYAFDFPFIGYRPLLAKSSDAAANAGIVLNTIPSYSADTVLAAIYNFDKVAKDTESALGNAIAALEDQTIDPVVRAGMSIVSPLDAADYLSEYNYPGISAYMSSIIGARDYALTVRGKLIAYIQRDVTAIGMYAVALKNYTVQLEELCTNLEALSVIPYATLKTLRDIGTRFLLLGRFPRYFKDSNTEVGT